MSFCSLSWWPVLSFCCAVMNLNKIDTKWQQWLGSDITMSFLVFVFYPIQKHWALALHCKKRTCEVNGSWGKERQRKPEELHFQFVLHLHLWARSDEFGDRCTIVIRAQRDTCSQLWPPKPHCLAKSLSVKSVSPCPEGWQEEAGWEVESRQGVLCPGKLRLSFPAPFHACVL